MPKHHHVIRYAIYDTCITDIYDVYIYRRLFITTEVNI